MGWAGGPGGMGGPGCTGGRLDGETGGSGISCAGLAKSPRIKRDIVSNNPLRIWDIWIGLPYRFAGIRAVS